MKIVVKVCLFLAVVAHLAFSVLQIFFWQSSFVQEKLLSQFTLQQQVEILAHNQGLYNGILAVGLLWGLFAVDPKASEIKAHWIAVFFLVAAFIAGVYGSISLGRPTAFLLQSLPGAIALPLIWSVARKH